MCGVMYNVTFYADRECPTYKLRVSAHRRGSVAPFAAEESAIPHFFCRGSGLFALLAAPTPAAPRMSAAPGASAAVAQIQPLFAHVDSSVIEMVWESSGRNVERTVESLLVMDGDKDVTLRRSTSSRGGTPAARVQNTPGPASLPQPVSASDESGGAIVLDSSVIVSVTPPIERATSYGAQAVPKPGPSSQQHSGPSRWRNEIPAEFLRLPGMNEWLALHRSSTASIAAESSSNSDSIASDEQLARALQNEMFQAQMRSNPELQGVRIPSQSSSKSRRSSSVSGFFSGLGTGMQNKIRKMATAFSSSGSSGNDDGGKPSESRGAGNNKDSPSTRSGYTAPALSVVGSNEKSNPTSSGNFTGASVRNRLPSAWRNASADETGSGDAAAGTFRQPSHPGDSI